ncbi:hypothetical protein ACFPL7_08690 [Dongia soli]|uniref:Uncharacterized protein n=1 Tax=Dongia soli TaxID=600628 RepID=A0ABU5EC27_9PROT|nr:hypothetical protein [Dongia soli]MDY0883023.1 hypothetical protein [Dongia soli]
MARKLFAFTVLTVVAAGWAGPAGADLAISRRDCQYLVNHQPAPDVAYQPGIDAHGRPVVPADLNSAGQIQLPDTIYIPIEVNLGRRFNIPPNSNLWKSTAEIGLVTVTGDQVSFNGQPLTPQDNSVLAALCREHGVTR